MLSSNRRAVIYARYSADRQRESSIDDQVRNCSRFAEREGLAIDHVYQDKAVSGAVRARADYLTMIDAGISGAFDVLLLDDLSRLSRDDYELKGVLRRLIWNEIRIIGVSDGYDSSHKGHKIHAGFKGLLNEVFLDDLRERTHRGMTGQALKGFNCGGRTYGFRNVPIEDPVRKDAYGRPEVAAVRYEIEDAQAEIVRKIFGWYGEGWSYKRIALELNRRRIPASRGGTWAVSAIKVILENEMYEGRVTWNRRAWIKHPETGKRTYKLRPREEWVVHENPVLRIVREDIVRSVRKRQKKKHVLFRPSSAQRYLFSGLLVCACCGSSFVIAAGGRYGCSAYKTRGPTVCTNSVTVSRHIVEERLLAGLKGELMAPKHVETFKRVARETIDAHSGASKEAEIRRKLATSTRERDNLVTAVKQGLLTPSTKEALQTAETEIDNLNCQLSELAQWKTPNILPRAMERYRTAVNELEMRLAGHVEPAREILKSLLGGQIRVHRRGDYLEAEIPNHVPALLAASFGGHFDSSGCGGPICNESKFVSLKAEPKDSTPIRYRHERRQLVQLQARDPRRRGQLGLAAAAPLGGSEK